MKRSSLLIGAALLATAGLAGNAAGQGGTPEDPAIRAANADMALEKANKLASRGKLDDAIPKYEEAIKLDPLGNTLAYYNLAEVSKVAKKCSKAVQFYQYYAHIEATKEARAEADAGVKACKGDEWAKLHIKVEPSQDAKIFINDVLASPGGEFGPVPMPVGEYSVRMEALDHHPAVQSVRLAAEDANVEVQLDKMTFFGTIKVNVEPANVKARIRIFEGPSDQTKVVAATSSPMKEVVKVREGRHFVEVTAEGYNRWIRNVSVGRDDEAVVGVSLRRETPKELQ